MIIDDYFMIIDDYFIITDEYFIVTDVCFILICWSSMYKWVCNIIIKTMCE